MRHANFWFVLYRSRDNFPKNDDLFSIRAFPIGADDCTHLKRGTFAETIINGPLTTLLSYLPISLGTLDCIGKFIRQANYLPGDNWANRIWRIDGSSGSLEREKIIQDFSNFDQPAILLISTRAGCVGINVTAATRYIFVTIEKCP